MVDLVDQHGVSFVSVTQQFNTTTSMGRLTLNILLADPVRPGRGCPGERHRPALSRPGGGSGPGVIGADGRSAHRALVGRHQQGRQVPAAGAFPQTVMAMSFNIPCNARHSSLILGHIAHSCLRQGEGEIKQECNADRNCSHYNSDCILIVLTKCIIELHHPNTLQSITQKMSKRVFNLRYLDNPRLPSMEIQTVAFVEEARATGKLKLMSTPVGWKGFNGFIRYSQNHIAADKEVGEALIIARIRIPECYRNRSWFWYYLRLCYALVKGGIVLECVVDEHLYNAFSMRPEFIKFQQNSFLLLHDDELDWLRLMDHPEQS